MKTEISQKDFTEWYPESLLPNMNEDQAISVLRGQYCRPMVVGGKCTTKCNNCQPPVSDIFQRLLSSQDIRDYRAVFVWHCKNAVAKAKEHKEFVPCQPRVDAFDRPLEVNLFLQFAQTIT